MIKLRLVVERSILKNITKIFLISVLILAFSLVLYNYKVDKFGVFNNKYSSVWKDTPRPNEAFLKRKFYLQNYQIYTSFIFGSTNALYVSTYNIPTSNWYNFADIYQTPTDSLEILNTILEKQKQDKNYYPQAVWLFIEPEYLYILNTQKTDYTNLPYPKSKFEKVLFYIKYLYKNPFHKEKSPFCYEQKLNFFTDGSYTSPRNKGSEIVSPCPFSEINKSKNNTSELLETIQKIINNCDDNGIALKIILTPQPVQKLLTFDKNDILNFKAELSKIYDFHDFWTENEITKNKENFSYNQTITANTGEKIIKSVISNEFLITRKVVENEE